MFHDPGRKGRPDPFDRSGTQIALHGGRILRHFRLKRLYMELLSIDRVFRIMALRLDGFTLADILERAHTGDLRPLVCQHQDCIAVLLIPEYDMVHIPGNGICHNNCPLYSSAAISAYFPVPTATASMGS